MKAKMLSALGAKPLNPLTRGCAPVSHWAQTPDPRPHL